MGASNIGGRVEGGVGVEFIASEMANVYIAQGFSESRNWLAARKNLRYGIQRMAINASKIFTASIRFTLYGPI